MPRDLVRFGGVGLALPVLALAGGCGRSAPGGSPTEVVVAAPGATVAAGPAQVTIERFGLRAEGVVDLSKAAVRLTVTDATAPGATPVEVLAVGDRAWARTAGTSSWVAADPEASGLLSLPGGLRSGDPRAALDLVRGASRVTVFGGLQVEATSAIRYDVFSDPLSAARAAGASVAPRLLAVAAQVNHPIRVDVYVDGDGRIRRLEVPEDLRSATPVTRPDTNRVSATIDFVRFGVDPGDLNPPA